MTCDPFEGEHGPDCPVPSGRVRPSRRAVRKARKQVELLWIEQQIESNRARLAELDALRECPHCPSAPARNDR